MGPGVCKVCHLHLKREKCCDGFYSRAVLEKKWLNTVFISCYFLSLATRGRQDEVMTDKEVLFSFYLATEEDGNRHLQSKVYLRPWVIFGSLIPGKLVLFIFKFYASSPTDRASRFVRLINKPSFGNPSRSGFPIFQETSCCLAESKYAIGTVL